MNKGKGLQTVLFNPVLWATIFAIITITFLVTVTYESTKAAVQVTANGDSQLIRTHSNTVKELLSELDVTVQPQDELSHELSDPVTYGMDLTYIAAKSINLNINGETKEYYTTADTVGDFLKEVDVKVKERDEVSHEAAASLKDGMDLHITHAFQVTFNDGGKEKKVWTTASTVEEFLKEHQVSLNPLDELKPAKGKALSANAAITLTRVEKVTDIVEEKVEFEIEKREDSSLAKGKQKVVSEGEHGLITKKYEVILKNGKEVSRKLLEEKVEKESKKKIVAIGTKAPERTPSRASSASSSSQTERTIVSRGNSSSAKVLYMHATAYTANCAGCSGITATGINLKANPNAKVIAVDPSVIPLGTRVWVEGYGYAVAGDTGGAINGNRIDVHVSTKSEALRFGRRNVKVKILD